ncbi:hypothetical protein KVR01_006477 [Diaporthe batatas]|uniref:uncharacterized protein n=1 Tax=Diaporthe batatas TaxID=748121 RepID=UPI001D04E2F2|nr:uncharacterized protein KVR01_006477 [Diaporthe batatas]KAG8164559.1 hypothetical protein KVR01_006477 [Diaporthe batatas]
MGGVDGNANSPATETTDVSNKPRQRRRDGYFWQLIVLRIPVAAFGIALIAYLVHYVRTWQGATRVPEDEDPNATKKDALGQSALALSMAAVSLVVAVWETLAYLTPRHRHGPKSLNFGLIFLDLLVVGLGIPGWYNFAMAEYYTSPDYETPWREYQGHAATMIMAFWILHCVMSIVGCSTCCGCCGIGSHPATAKATGTPETVQPAPQPDLEGYGSSEPVPNYKSSSGLEEVEPVTSLDEPPSYPEATRLAPDAKS